MFTGKMVNIHLPRDINFFRLGEFEANNNFGAGFTGRILTQVIRWTLSRVFTLRVIAIL